MPAKLAARVRAFDTGQGRKTDATDAHAIAMVALRTPRLRELAVDEDLVALRLLVDRRDALSRRRTQTVNQLHRLLLELIPGGAPRHLSALQAKTLLAGVRPRDLAGRTRRRLAADLIGEVAAVDAKLKDLKGQLRQAVLARGSHLMDLYGVGPAGAARILVDVADVVRFPTRGHFAAWNGTAPLDASSGEQRHHRLSRAGNRRLNHVLHIAAVVQLRNDTDGRAYYKRKVKEGKGPLGGAALPAPPDLRRGLPPARRRRRRHRPSATGRTRRAREGTPGRLHSPARPTGPRTSALRISHNPSPQPDTVAATPHRPKRRAASAAAPPRRRARGVKVERPTGRTTLTPTSAGAP